jgi:hypothetical protein
MGKTASAAKPEIKRRRIDSVNYRGESVYLFFRGFPQEGERQVQVFRPGETPSRALRTEPLLDLKYPAFKFIAEINGNKKAHN